MKKYLTTSQIYLLFTNLYLYNEEELNSYLKQSPFLPPDFLQKIAQYHYPKRRQELLISRFLIHQIISLFKADVVFYDSVAKKVVRWRWKIRKETQETLYISFSHTNNCLTFAIADSYPIGLDIETPVEKQSKMFHVLKKLFPKFHIPNDITIMTYLWAIHEALYKLGLSKEEEEKWIDYFLENLRNKIHVIKNNYVYNFRFNEHTIVLWQEGFLPYPGALIVKKTACDSVRIYCLSRKKHAITKKPCESLFTRLVCLDKELEIPLC